MPELANREFVDADKDQVAHILQNQNMQPNNAAAFKIPTNLFVVSSVGTRIPHEPTGMLVSV